MIALKENTKNKIITLASKQNISIQNLAKTILKITKSKSKIIFNKHKRRFDDFTSNYLYNKKSNVNEVNWIPKNNLESGLKKYIKEKYDI